MRETAASRDMKQSGVNTVFVYGTLKKDYGNNRLLLESRFLGQFITAPQFDIYDVGPDGGFPVLYTGPHSILGEIYEVDVATLHSLDRLEGHPTLYTRTLIEIPGHGTCFVYMSNLNQGFLENIFQHKNGHREWNPRRHIDANLNDGDWTRVIEAEITE